MHAPASRALDVDPVLLALTVPGSPYTAPDDCAPPSLIDSSIIDPLLLALYPAPDLDPTPNPNSSILSSSDDASAIHDWSPFDDSEYPAPSTASAPFQPSSDLDDASSMHDCTTSDSSLSSAPSSPSPPPATTNEPCSQATSVNTASPHRILSTKQRTARAGVRYRRRTLTTSDADDDAPESTGRRRRSNGTLIPPAPCTRCKSRPDECRVVHLGGACNACNRNRRKCSLVDPTVNSRTGRKRSKVKVSVKE